MLKLCLEISNCLKIQVTLHPTFIWMLRSCLNIKLFKNTSNTSPKFYLDAEVMLRNYIKLFKNTSNTSPKFYLDAEVMLRNYIKLFKNTSNTSPNFYLDAEVMLYYWVIS